jgi:hypothetical protein
VAIWLLWFYILAIVGSPLRGFLDFFSFVSEFDWASHSERRSMID